jgi:hypothetical protein
MSRGLSVAQINASASGHRVVAPLLELQFVSGTLRLACFRWDVPVGANTFIKAAISINKARESATSTEGMEFQLNGLDPAIIAIATAEPYHGRTCRLLKAYIQADNNQIIGSQVVTFIGRMRNMVTNEDNTTAQVTLFAEHYDAELTKPSPLRLTDADQQSLFPGDKGCEYAASNAEKTVIWPSKKAQKYGNPQPTYRNH